MDMLTRHEFCILTSGRAPLKEGLCVPLAENEKHQDKFPRELRYLLQLLVSRDSSETLPQFISRMCFLGAHVVPTSKPSGFAATCRGEPTRFVLPLAPDAKRRRAPLCLEHALARIPRGTRESSDPPRGARLPHLQVLAHRNPVPTVNGGNRKGTAVHNPDGHNPFERNHGQRSTTVEVPGQLWWRSWLRPPESGSGEMGARKRSHGVECLLRQSSGLQSLLARKLPEARRSCANQNACEEYTR